MTRRVLAVRLDSAGDMLLTGPALRAMAAGADELLVLAGPLGEEAARLLRDVHDVLGWRCPWIDADPSPVDVCDVRTLVRRLADLRVECACVFTSFRQSPLPTALLLRLPEVPRIEVISYDYPGALLDVRHRVREDLPEPERALSLASAAGFPLPTGDDGRLAVRRPLPDMAGQVPARRYVVVHPGASAPARAWPAYRFGETVRCLESAGWPVLITGSPGEAALADDVAAGTHATVLAGRTSLPELAAVLAGAAAVVVANTGPAHLAAAVGTPVVSLFAPTVPAVKWAPYRVPHVLLGDQHAPCRDTRATVCPTPGHPCLTSVTARDVEAAVSHLAGLPDGASAPAPGQLQEVR